MNRKFTSPHSVFAMMLAKMSEKDHLAAVSIADSVLKDDCLTAHQYNEFLYYKGICLDYSGKHLEAVEVFLHLSERHPYSINYRTSLSVALGNIRKLTCDLIASKPDAPEILNYEETLVELDWCPSLIRIHAAIMRAGKGEKPEEAIKLVRAYLALSPNDDDYLKAGFDIAMVTRDVRFKNELIVHVSGLLKKYPYRFKLAELLEMYSE